MIALLWPFDPSPSLLRSHLLYGPLSISDMDRCCEKLAVMMMTLQHDIMRRGSNRNTVGFRPLS